MVVVIIVVVVKTFVTPNANDCCTPDAASKECKKQKKLACKAVNTFYSRQQVASLSFSMYATTPLLPTSMHPLSENGVRSQAQLKAIPELTPQTVPGSRRFICCASEGGPECS